jgi:AraC-like DNA-binding protein
MTISLSEDLLASIAGGDPDPGHDLAMIDPRVDVGLRLLMTSARAGDAGGEVTEGVVGLLAALIGQRAPERVAAGRPSTIRARRRIVDETRLLLNLHPSLSLIDLAGAVGYSPHHLSRVFKQLTGTTVSRYRNLLRVREAMARLSEGHDDLALLAAEVGFADNAHLTRTVGALTGFAPSILRQALRDQPSARVKPALSSSPGRDVR